MEYKPPASVLVNWLRLVLRIPDMKAFAPSGDSKITDELTDSVGLGSSK